MCTECPSPPPGFNFGMSEKVGMREVNKTHNAGNLGTGSLKCDIWELVKTNKVKIEKKQRHKGNMESVESGN